jgi:hypothetical protein
LALAILVTALILGVLGDALLRATPWGINVALWVAALIVAAGLVTATHWRHVGITGEGVWLIWPALFFAGAFAWRDSLTLQCLNGLGLVVALSLAALRSRSGRICVASVTEYALGVLLVAANAVMGCFPLLFGDVQWKEIPRGKGYTTAVAAARGVLLATPPRSMPGAGSSSWSP